MGRCWLKETGTSTARSSFNRMWLRLRSGTARTDADRGLGAAAGTLSNLAGGADEGEGAGDGEEEEE